MTPAFIEHVNLTVSDPDRAAQMLRAIFGWEERWRGASALGGRTIHVGAAASYVALYSPEERPVAPIGHAKGRPLNHLGIEVDDLGACEARVLAAGLTPFNHGDYPPGRRFYFFDPDGIEYEVVSYKPPA